MDAWMVVCWADCSAVYWVALMEMLLVVSKGAMWAAWMDRSMAERLVATMVDSMAASWAAGMAVEMDNWTAENLVADWADKKVSSTAALMAAWMGTCDKINDCQNK